MGYYTVEDNKSGCPKGGSIHQPYGVSGRKHIPAPLAGNAAGF
nr:hypothetical protein [Evansella caseinilytica]